MKYQGALYIDVERGTVSFWDKHGNRILRVTHLDVPIPDNVSIDVVAIKQVTSYTPVEPVKVKTVLSIDDPCEQELGPE